MTAVKLRALEADADSSRKLYDAFLSRLTAIQDQDGLQYPDAHVISRAPVPAAPSSPQRMLIVMASIPAGLLLGCLAALLSLRFAGARRYEPVVVRPVPRPVPAPAPARCPGRLRWSRRSPRPPFKARRCLPTYRAHWRKARRITSSTGRPRPSRAPSARCWAACWRTAIPRRGRVVAVTTSESPAAGDHGRARSPWRAPLRGGACAPSWSTAIWPDPSLRKPRASVRRPDSWRSLPAPRRSNRALVRDPAFRCAAARAGQAAARPQGGPGLPQSGGKLLAHLRGICDLAIVAAPPVLESAEAPSFARLSDAVVMVAHPDERPRPGLGKALSALAQWRSAPVGVVLVR